jgi:hypothetical protein
VDDTVAPAYSTPLPSVNLLPTQPVPFYTSSAEIIAIANFTDNCELDYNFWKAPSLRVISNGDCEVIREYTYEIRDLCGNATPIVQNIITTSSGPIVLAAPTSRRGCYVPAPLYHQSTMARGWRATRQLHNVTLTYRPERDILTGDRCNGVLIRRYLLRNPCGCIRMGRNGLSRR